MTQIALMKSDVTSRSYSWRRLGAIVFLTSFLSLTGCINHHTKPAYFGPTLPLHDVIQQINEKNAPIDTLWSSGTFSAHLIDPETGKTTSGDGDITALYAKEKSLRLSAKVLGEKVFDLGSNDDRYWLIIPGKTDTMWWGYHRLIGSQRAGRLPVRPDLLIQVLGIGHLNADLLKEPAPTLRFNNDEDCYMITWTVRLSDRWAIQKEVWYDRQTLRPKLVLLFDADGRVTLRAYLLDPQPVEGYPAVTLASRYDMFFPESKSTFSIHLQDLRRSKPNLPGPKTFQFPESPDVSKIIAVDEP